MKKFPFAAGALSLSLLLTAGCSGGGNKTTNQQNNASSGKGGKVVIDLFQGKVEIADQLKALTQEYTKEHPDVTFNLQTVGGGADASSALKARFASGNAPDIFTIEGYQSTITWKDKLEDLSDQPWVKDAYDNALKPTTLDGKIYGQPANMEGYGFIYNKELFKKVGITDLPKTMTQLADTAQKLKAAGITPFAVGYAEWWVLGNHGLNMPFTYQKDPDAFIKGLNSGTEKIAGNPLFLKYLDLLDLTVKYGNTNPLTTDYNTEVTSFASGNTAMIQQGNWIQPMLDKLHPKMDVGILPMPLSDDPAVTDKLAVDVPNSWVVYKGAPAADKKAAKDFLNWLVTSDAGKKAMVEQFKYIPAFKTITATADQIGPLGAVLQEYSKAGKTFSWQFPKFPEGASQQFGSVLQTYIAGKASKDETLKSLDDTWAKLKK